MQPSRRAFLMAGRPRTDPWGRFFQRLARTVKGRTEDRSPSAGEPGLAWLRPASFTDIHHALALCAEFDVVFSLDCVRKGHAMPCLLVDPSSLCSIVESSGHAIEVEAGARVGDVRTRLKQQSACPGGEDDWTVAQWLAAPVPYPPVSLHASGLVGVEVLLADRTMESFGPFGATSQRVALSLGTSRLISDLFTIVSRPQVAAWRDLVAWPARYRLDALMAQTPNLAHILLGSGAGLAWPDRVRLEVVPDGMSPGQGQGRAVLPDDIEAARALDVLVKQRFDPAGRFA